MIKSSPSHAVLTGVRRVGGAAASASEDVVLLLALDEVTEMVVLDNDDDGQDAIAERIKMHRDIARY